MLQSKKNNSGKWWIILKIFLALLALWFIYDKVFQNENSKNYLLQLEIAFNTEGTTLLFALVVILMLLNWIVEAVKWRFMILKIEQVSLRKSLEAVFSGLTISFFTPNRIGEYAGRVFHLESGKRMQATFVTVIENSSQLLITILTGCVASIIFLRDYLALDSIVYLLLSILLVLFGLFCLLLYFNLYIFEKLFLKIRMTDYWRKIIHVFALYSFGDLLKVLTLSLLRYLIFTLQYFILLHIYGYSNPIALTCLMTAMTFFVMSVVPTFTIAELGVRGAVSAYFFSKITIDIFPVLNAGFSLWIINLALPALIGAFFIFNFRLEKISK